ncbi:MAG: phosphatase PAP2 family protein [Planctomycetota bacterium]|nr:phosphatase PAP2 family protein [Planctomycetota bacterium]
MTITPLSQPGTSSDAPQLGGAAGPSGMRRAWRIFGLWVIAGAALIPLDQVLHEAIRGLRPGGDLRRELELLQQFGSPTTIALCALLIWRLDPARLRRVIDWALAAAASWGAVMVLKMLVGRPRPKFGEHLHALGPWRAYVVHEGDPPRYAWQFWQRDITEIWSMPSSHTAAAATAAVMLSALYPRLRPVVWSMAALVGFCRVMFKAHYPSDVIIGGAMGAMVAWLFVRRWGAERG